MCIRDSLSLAHGQTGTRMITSFKLFRDSYYSSALTEWRRQREAGAFEALKPLRRGPKPVVAQPADADLGQLRRENARLRQRLEHAEAIIGIQKKVAALLGMPMAAADCGETP